MQSAEERGVRVAETGKEVPLYLTVCEELRRRIASGEYPVHSRIPSEFALSDSFSVSRVTVRKALEALESEGLLERFQGRGTYVALPRIAKNLSSVTSFHETCMMMGLQPSTKVIRTEMVEMTERDKHYFSDFHSSKLLEMTRLCLADNEPVMVEKNRYAPSLSWLRGEELTDSVYTILKQKGIEPDRGSHEISLRYAENACLLNITPGEALLYVFEAIRDKKGRMIHLSEQYVRGDRFTFRI